MRKSQRLSTIVSTLALAPWLAPGAAGAAGLPQTAGVVPVATGHSYADGRYTGRTFDAYYGQVKVQLDISNGQIASVDILDYPNHTGTSRYINSQALPMLKRKLISAQDVRVNMVSGATLTSEAFLRSAYTALQKAGN